MYDTNKNVTKMGMIINGCLLYIIVMTFLVRECYGSPKKHENSLKFVKIHTEKCFDKVLNEEF
jgi:hypothetical protein